MPRLVQYKPRRLNRMPRIEQPPIKMVEQFALRPHVLHHALEIRLHEVALDLAGELGIAVDESGESIFCLSGYEMPELMHWSGNTISRPGYIKLYGSTSTWTRTPPPVRTWRSQRRSTGWTWTSFGAFRSSRRRWRPRSTASGAGAVLSVSGTATGQDFIVEISSSDPDVRLTYALELSLVGATCTGDQFEPNDGPGDATEMTLHDHKGKLRVTLNCAKGECF